MNNIFINEGIIEPLHYFFKKKNKTNLVIICGDNSFPKELNDFNFKNYNIQQIHYFNGFSVNPQFNQFYDALLNIKKIKPDVIIGVGGGTVIDISKMLCFFITFNISKNEIQSILKNSKPKIDLKEKPELILMPTTAGSGAESTSFSVIYINDIKYSFFHKSLKPKNVICDLSLIYNAPNYVLSCSGLDALVQSIESILSIQSNSKSEEYASLALKLIWNSIEPAINKKDSLLLKNMVNGSHLAGQAINISKTTGNHALSYKITSLYGIPHGHCVAIL